MKKIKKIIPSIVFAVFPTIALADVTIPPVPAQLPDVITVINRILDFIWPLFIGLAVIMFIVAGFMFLTAQGEADKVKLARWAVLYGAVGVAVGVLAFSIPYVIIRWFS